MMLSELGFVQQPFVSVCDTTLFGFKQKKTHTQCLCDFQLMSRLKKDRIQPRQTSLLVAVCTCRHGIVVGSIFTFSQNIWYQCETHQQSRIDQLLALHCCCIFNPLYQLICPLYPAWLIYSYILFCWLTLPFNKWDNHDSEEQGAPLWSTTVSLCPLNAQSTWHKEGKSGSQTHDLHTEDCMCRMTPCETCQQSTSVTA